MNSITGNQRYNQQICNSASQKTAKSSNKTSSKNFDELASETAKLSNASKTSNATIIQKKDMSIEEYKKYLHEEISKLPIHPSLSTTNIGIFISDKGFEAMKNDLEYEKWVLGKIKNEFVQNDPPVNNEGENFKALYFGGKTEDFKKESWTENNSEEVEDKRVEKKPKMTFWERRRETFEKYIEMSLEYSKKLNALNEVLEDEHIHSKRIENENLRREMAGEEEKLPYLEGVPASKLLSLLG